MSSALLTVVIPTYQRQAELQRALESLQQPGCESIEVVISDNASTDSTEAYARGVQLPFAKNYLRNPENVGICHNFYQASRAAQGRYQMWMTDDDFLVDGALSRLLDAIRANEDCGYFHSHVCSIEDGAPVDESADLIGPSLTDFHAEPGVETVIEYVRYGWAYSRQTLQNDLIDWDLWQRHLMNAYIPAVMVGNMLLHHRSFYQAENIVAHTVGNEKHWEEFGADEFHIALRTQADYRNIMSAVFDRTPETPITRRAIRRWERGCDESCFNRIRKKLATMPVDEACRELERGYKVPAEMARRMVRRAHSSLWDTIERPWGKRMYKRYVRVRGLT